MSGARWWTLFAGATAVLGALTLLLAWIVSTALMAWARADTVALWWTFAATLTAPAWRVATWAWWYIVELRR